METRRPRSSSHTINMTLSVGAWGEQIEALSEDFPLLKDICKGLKKNQYPAALFVAGGTADDAHDTCTV